MPPSIIVTYVSITIFNYYSRRYVSSINTNSIFTLVIEMNKIFLGMYITFLVTYSASKVGEMPNIPIQPYSIELPFLVFLYFFLLRCLRTLLERKIHRHNSGIYRDKLERFI